MIEFAALPMLASLLAAAVPYLLLRNRVRWKREIPWSSNRLLLEAIKDQSRRLNWLQILLLVLRTLAIVGLALAVADPYWKADRGTTLERNQSPSFHIFVMDSSPSMTLSHNTRSGNITSLAMAIDQVRKQLTSLREFDLVGIVAGGRNLNIAFLGDCRQMSEIDRTLRAIDSPPVLSTFRSSLQHFSG